MFSLNIFSCFKTNPVLSDVKKLPALERAVVTAFLKVAENLTEAVANFKRDRDRDSRVMLKDAAMKYSGASVILVAFLEAHHVLLPESIRGAIHAAADLYTGLLRDESFLAANE